MKNILIAFAVIFFTACNSDDIDIPKDYTEENDQEIQKYISDNNLTAQKSSSGLYYVIDNPGLGDNPISTDRVKVVYKGYYTNGITFDESNDEGISFNLQQVIRGWTEGITYFMEGGSGKLLIPAHLAYGSNDYNGIPGGSVLIFDIELIYVNYKTENEVQIQQYLIDNNLVTEKTDSGLHYIIDVIGDGEQPTNTDTVSVIYKGYLINDNVFDQTAETVDFELQKLIPGFSEGLTYFNEGGSGTLIIPAHLAYGNNNNISVIPAGSVLIFDISLITIDN